MKTCAKKWLARVALAGLLLPMLLALPMTARAETYTGEPLVDEFGSTLVYTVSGGQIVDSGFSEGTGMLGPTRSQSIMVHAAPGDEITLEYTYTKGPDIPTDVMLSTDLEGGGVLFPIFIKGGYSVSYNDFKDGPGAIFGYADSTGNDDSYSNSISMPVLEELMSEEDDLYGLLSADNYVEYYDPEVNESPGALMSTILEVTVMIYVVQEAAPESEPESEPSGPILQEEDTIADEAAGTTQDTQMLPIIVLGAAGLAVALGVGLTGGGVDGGGEGGEAGENDPMAEEEVSDFYMRVYKNFGDTIRYGDEAQVVYACILEQKKGGGPFARPDLSARIQIIAGSPLAVSPAGMSGEYQAAYVQAPGDGQGAPRQGAVSFRFAGPGGTFQNNMHFKLLGQPSVFLPGKTPNLAYILAGDDRERSFALQISDFAAPPHLHIEMVPDAAPFFPTVEMNTDGSWVLLVANHSEASSQFERFEESYNIEIEAENDTERATCWVTVAVCYEGILPIFYKGEKYIKGYLDRETGKMGITLVDFRMGLWDENAGELVYRRPPEEFAFTYSDEQRISDIIGVAAHIDPEQPGGDLLRYQLQADKSYPSNRNLPGEMLVMCNYGERTFEHRATVPLVPDIDQYKENASLQEEYENCMYIIRSYMPEDQVGELMRRTRQSFEQNGYCVEDLRAWRHAVWGQARSYIEREHRDYMRDADFYDWMVSICDIAVFVGDIALDIVLMPVGGPLASFIITNGKNLLVDMIGKLTATGSYSMDDAAEVMLGSLGSLDGLVSSTPKPTEYKKLAIWLCGFFAYRFCYHAAITKDDQGNSLRWIPAGKQAVKDLGLKTVMASFVACYSDRMLPYGVDGDTMIGKTRDEALLKPMTDIGDGVVEKIDDATTKAITDAMEWVYNYLISGMGWL